MTIETANRLYELRKKHGLSQEELAEKLGVSRQAVSKWERSEASPDTDNLIALAKIYDLSLDELIYGERESKEEKAEEKAEEDKKGINRVNIGPTGIFIESDEGDKVQINLKGIKVTEGKHIHINDEYDDEDEDEDEDNDDDDDIIIRDGHFHFEIDKPKNKLLFWLTLPYPIICAIAYLIFGCLNILGGWGLSWIIFVTIPIYYSLIEAICKRRFSEFAYPVFTAFAYLLTGMYFGNWHPSWIIFVTIPLYYCIADTLDKMIRQKSEFSDTKQ